MPWDAGQPAYVAGGRRRACLSAGAPVGGDEYLPAHAGRRAPSRSSSPSTASAACWTWTTSWGATSRRRVAAGSRRPARLQAACGSGSRPTGSATAWATVYPFPRDLLRESQRLHARQRLLGLNLIRSNPQIAGYNLTGMLDHGYTGEGVWTFWREWKPGIVDALQDGFAPLRWCLFVTPRTPTPGRTVTVEAVLANEDVLPPGEYPARLRIFGPAGPVWEQPIAVQIPAPAAGQRRPAGGARLQRGCAAGRAGRHLHAGRQLEQGGSPAGDRMTFHCLGPRGAAQARRGGGAVGGRRACAAWLAAHGLRCRPVATATGAAAR